MLAIVLLPMAMNAKTLVAYYSFTNNVKRIVTELGVQIDADVVEIEPAEKGLDYAANNYALGTQLLNAIRNNPDDASSYPAIDPVDIDMSAYDMVIIAVPLWWGQMAAPFQTFLFHYGPQMAGKNIGVIVSSASTGISGVVADAKRLIPRGNFIEPNLWIRSSQTSNAGPLISEWLEAIHYSDLTSAVSSILPDRDFEIALNNRVIRVNGKFDSLSLYDISGCKMAETHERYVDANGFNAGVYIVEVAADNVLTKRKVLLR